MRDDKLSYQFNDDFLENISAGKKSGFDCGIQEGQFPKPGICYGEVYVTPGMSYAADITYNPICPYCSIWTSPPEGANLVVSHMFECKMFGYAKLIKE